MDGVTCDDEEVVERVDGVKAPSEIVLSSETIKKELSVVPPLMALESVALSVPLKYSSSVPSLTVQSGKYTPLSELRPSTQL